MSLINLYYQFRSGVLDVVGHCRPLVRQFIRFLALPYCYFHMVDWKSCPKARLQVAGDFAYLFFVLKHFPANYSMHRLWELERKQWAYYFGSIYDPLQRFAIDRELLPKDNQILTSDKGLWHIMARSLEIPTPRYFGEIDPDDEFRERIYSLLNSENVPGLFIKPQRGAGGRNAVVARMVEGEVIITDAVDNARPLSKFTINESCVIEEAITQHSGISDIYSSSVNSIRFITVLTRAKMVHEIGAMMKFGIGGSMIDNRSRGGIAVRIDLEGGVLSGNGISMSGEIFESHPDSGIRFDGTCLPCWQEIREVAKETQRKFTFQKLLGQDIALTPDGPVIMELNSHPDTLGFEQVCGPLFRNRETWEIFSEWDLLISRPVRQLYS